MTKKYISGWVYISAFAFDFAFIFVNWLVDFGNFLDIYGDFLFFGIAVLIYLIVMGMNEITFKENVNELLKEKSCYVKKVLYKISKPVITPRQHFLKKIVNKYDGRVYVEVSLDLELNAPYTKKEVFRVLQNLIRDDFLDVWHEVKLVSKEMDNVKRLRDKSKDMMSYTATFRIPQGVRPSTKPPYNGYSNEIVYPFIENVSMERI